MARLQSVLDKFATDMEKAGPKRLPAEALTLEKRLADAVRDDMAELYSGVLSTLGRIKLYGTPDGYRKVSVCTWFGYVSYHCAYYGPDPARESRQTRRRLKREKALVGQRQRKNGVFERKGGAPCAYPLQKAMNMRDGMTEAFSDAAQRTGVLAGSFEEGSAVLRLFLGVVMPCATFRRKMLAAGERALQAQEFPLLRLLTPHLPAWLLASTTATLPTLYIMLDGTGVPCVKKDTEGIKGKGKDGKAGTREVKVAIVGTYRRLNRNGRPRRDPGCESHLVSSKQASAFGILLRKLADSRRYRRKAFRVQIVGDEAEWILNIVRKTFPGKAVIFTNDFYHACEYLHAFISLAEPMSEKVKTVYRRAKSILYRAGGAGLVKYIRKRYAELKDEHLAWEKLKYIEKRVYNMRYMSIANKDYTSALDLLRLHVGLTSPGGANRLACTGDIIIQQPSVPSPHAFALTFLPLNINYNELHPPSGRKKEGKIKR